MLVDFKSISYKLVAVESISYVPVALESISYVLVALNQSVTYATKVGSLSVL